MGNSLVRSLNNDVRLPDPCYFMDPNSISTIINTCTATVTYTLRVMPDYDNGKRNRKILSDIDRTLEDLVFPESDKEKISNNDVYICSISVKSIMNPLNVPIPVVGGIGWTIDPLKNKKSEINNDDDDEDDDGSMTIFEYSIPENTGSNIQALGTPEILYKHPLFIKDPTSNPLYVYAPIKKMVFNEKEVTEQNKKRYIKVDAMSPTYKMLFSYRSHFEKLLKDEKKYDDISSDMISTSISLSELNDDYPTNDMSNESKSVIIEKSAYEIFKKETNENILKHINHVDFETSYIGIDNSSLQGLSKEKKAALGNKLQRGMMTETETDIFYRVTASITFETRSYLIPKTSGVNCSSYSMRENKYLNNPSSNFGNKNVMGTNESMTFHLHPFSNEKKSLPKDVNPMEKYVFNEKKKEKVVSVESKTQKNTSIIFSFKFIK